MGAEAGATTSIFSVLNAMVLRELAARLRAAGPGRVLIALAMLYPLGLLAIIPLRDLGPLPGDKLFHTIWKKGMRVVQEFNAARSQSQFPTGGTH